VGVGRPAVVVALALGGFVWTRAAPSSGQVAETAVPSPLTMVEAVALFRRDGFDLLIADADVQAAAGDLATATAVANPTATAGYLHSFFANGLYETHAGWLVGIGDANVIADALAGKRELRGRVARAAFAAARLRRLDVRRTLELGVKDQYVAVAAAEGVLRVSREVVDTAEHTFVLNQVRYERGAISEVDLAKTETAKLEADQGVAAAAQALAQAKVLLAFLMGQRTPSVTYEVDAGQIRFRVPEALERATLASLIETARRARPDLLSQTNQCERAVAAASLARRQRFPDLGLSVQYQQEGSANQGPGGPQPVTPPTLQLSVTGTLPFFYQQQGEIRRAEADVAAQGALLAKTEAQVAADVESAYAAFETARFLVARMEERLLERARRARDLTALQYEKGATSLLEYLDAQRTYIAVNAEYLQDLANYWDAVFQLEAASATELL
jgi:cobalt-zinc-cadmium efflux system outer membrane protein